MDRAERAGTGVAVAGHVLLFGLLSFAVGTPDPAERVPPPPMEVELIDEVALEASAPTPAAMQAAEAPEVGPPEEAAPAPAPPAEPLPAAPAPEPLPAPPPVAREAPPVPRPVPQPVARPTPPPVARPVVRVRPQPTPKPVAAKPAPAKPAPVKVAAKPPRARPSAAPAKIAAKPAAASGGGEKTASRGSRLGKDFLAGLSDPAAGQAKAAAVAPAMSAKARADIGSAIKRQVDPCARRQVLTGPGAERIKVTIRLQLNRDGSLAARPSVVEQTGVDDENSRYAARVNDLAIAAFTGCAPLRGLPDDLYDVKRGWKNFSLRFSLPARG